MEDSATIEHDFSIVLDEIQELSPIVEDAFFEAGCDDATMSFREGRLFLTFTRRAVSRSDAIESARQDITAALNRIGLTSEIRFLGTDTLRV